MLNKQDAIKIARENILPFWHNLTDDEYGGFYGEADFFGNIKKKANKGCILNSRILWTFSAAHRLFADDSYKSCAANAKNFLSSAFFDRDFGGLYWLVDYKGKQQQTRKQFYNIAFGIYALSEHYLAFNDQSSLELAMYLFDVMEKFGFDPENGGYIEARVRDWRDIDDFRLSSKDLNCPKSMNTNLHILEAYTALVRAGNDEKVKKALDGLLRIALDKIINNRHFGLFFDMKWNSLSKDLTYGHDIEGSWLICEAALSLGDSSLINSVKQTALSIAEVIYTDAIDRANGGLFRGRNEKGELPGKKEWWTQAEAVVGFYNAYELSGDKKYLDAADNIWEFINQYFIDHVKGEWHNELFNNNIPDSKMPKAGFWKCPYHNARMCFEIIRRLDSVSG